MGGGLWWDGGDISLINQHEAVSFIIDLASRTWQAHTAVSFNQLNDWLLGGRGRVVYHGLFWEYCITVYK